MYDTSHFERVGASKTCPCCGAPITGDVCEYCDTVFVDVACIHMNKPTMLKIMDADGIIRMIQCQLRRIEERVPETVSFYANNNLYMSSRSLELNLLFEMAY